MKATVVGQTAMIYGVLRPCEPARELLSAELRAVRLPRLRTAAGQVNGVARKVESDRYCMDVKQQLDAAQKALEQVGKMITRNYLERCVTGAMSSGHPLIYDELMRIIYRGR